MLNHHFVICTFNRPRELYVCLRMLANQDLLPRSITLVCTNEQDIGEDAHHALALLTDKGVRVQSLFSDRGLTLQRNVALKNVPSEANIVTFIDDDIILPQNYLFKMNEIFTKDKSCIGLGGITSDNSQSGRTSIIRRMFLLDSKSPGKVLKSGVNTSFKFSNEPYEVQWLSGCCMSFRSDTLKKIAFDTRRVKVGWGEDVDFSLKAGAHGKLLAFYLPGIVHTQSRRNRSSNLERAKQNDLSRLLLARDKLGNVSVGFIYLSLFGELLINLRVLNQITIAAKVYSRNLLASAITRLLLIAKALKLAFRLNRKVKSVNPLTLAFRTIRLRFDESRERFHELRRNVKGVKRLAE